MTPVDRDVLALLRNGNERELVLTPGVIAVNSDWERQTVREHLLRLSDERLVEYHDEARALYQLTDRGRRYIRGDLGADALEPDD
jgi:predicted transcriptional regulator